MISLKKVSNFFKHGVNLCCLASTLTASFFHVACNSDDGVEF